MIDERLPAAERLASHAKRLSADGDHHGAAQSQAGAVELYQQRYDAELADRALDEVERKQARPFVHRLADHYGRLGGTQRRAGQRAEALASYGHGAKLESDWELDDTYNRTNEILLALLSRAATVADLTPKINALADVVQDQVDRTRRDSWWAWADLGILQLLQGRPPTALWAYDHFVDVGARRTAYDSTLTVLREVQSALTTLAPELVDGFAEAIEHLERNRGS